MTQQIQILTRTVLSVLLLNASVVGVFVFGSRLQVQSVLAAPLEQRFLHPTEEAKPWVYWYWNNGNYSKPGVTADLEAMKKIGIGGCTVAITSMMAPKGNIEFGTPEWMDTVMHAIREAGRLGMHLSIMNCEGWGVAGGPWITPEMGQKKLVWTTTNVSGAKGVDRVLAQPETKLDFYRDVAVLAYPKVPYGRINGKDQLRNVDANWSPEAAEEQGGIDALFDDDASTRLFVSAGQKELPVVAIELKKASPARAITIRWLGWTMPSMLKLEVSDDGETYRTLVDEEPGDDFGVAQMMMAVNSRTFSFPVVTSKFWRISMRCGFGAMEIVEAELTAAPRINNMEIKAAFQQTHAWGRTEEITFRTTDLSEIEPELPKESLVALKDVRNISKYMDSSGRLQWEPPKGDWTVLRLGYTATEEPISPATDSGRGLECDKLDSDIVRFQFEQLVAKLAERAGPLAGTAYEGVWIDSWEAHGQNWTEKFPEEFKRRRGYDLIPYLPLITTGQIVESPEVCERLLWDFRRTIADMVREEFFGTARAWINERGLKLTGEFAGMAGHLYDPINYMMEADVPVGEFWSLRGEGGGQDIRVAASLAHTSGRPTVGAEAYTDWGGYDKYPSQMKPLGDEALCAGVNRFIFHTYSHQPWADPKPGMSFGPWGISFHRGNTWWEPSRQWITYLSRCQQLLREGQFVADICYYIGDDAPNFVGRRDSVWKPIPPGRDFDCVNTEILKQFRVIGGRLVLPSGMSYRTLLLPNRPGMLPESLEIVHSLVEQGAVVVGPPPVRSPSLKDFPRCDQRVNRLARVLWGPEAVAARCGNANVATQVDRQVGQGRVVSGLTWTRIFETLGEPDDFTVVTSDPEVKLQWIHRRTEDADIYFLANPKSKSLDTLCTFRVTDRQPEVWDPDTGAMRTAVMYQQVDGRTQLPIHFDPAGSLFVIFRGASAQNHVVGVKRSGEMLFNPAVRKPIPLPEMQLLESTQIVVEADVAATYELTLADGAVRTVAFEKGATEIPVAGPWEVSFQPGRGAPASLTLETLIDLSQHDDPGVKYFSGTASYMAHFKVPSHLLRTQAKIALDLGDVQVIAEVKVNGKSLGIVWKSPFTLDLTGAIKSGPNELVVEATNLWVNRLVGDEQFADDCEWKFYSGDYTMEQWPDWFINNEPRPTKRMTFFPYKHHVADTKLPKSGLLGPVQIRVSPRVEVAASGSE
ncbi:MAG: hypothetical protein MK171_02100 [Pirellulales bacterium]|nr:hypothetical protein [Pirellulales bacterium]